MKSKYLFGVIILSLLFFSAKITNKHPLLKAEIMKDFVEIPGGKVSIGSQEFHVKGFYITKFEVTNVSI